MGAAKREAEAFEEMKADLAQIAIATGAAHLDEEDGETLLTQCNANAERHAYARLTNLCKSQAKLPKRERRSTQRLFEELRGRGYATA